ncbi:class I poly(R)-hydroxyalkanoic acid synthase [Microvirga tunisiensis]|uniref:Class I poly(R)-hydroxyalkanoic acid synthase n=2 Tax=Pannonibacter tanglangensis TaxID=2750084 RepID=A0ABW9ZCB2_9HYPH|nr:MULTISPECIES: class I poly(R)-hydroxyalkanoic acid synthase [unclassified Pannonibacter]NBN62485.1 class I poly(R)-hydroxyalkanoic acid synthase [Pannonibacter sp. XCT-34]NBN78141.1 class I poly(R)-hydroxyalkanoic acid synthase [Pannonibacter sp. XCT-53]
MADDRQNPLVQYIVKNPEAFAQNLAKLMEQGGKALAAYLEPREKGEVKPDTAEELTTIIKTLAQVGEYWTADPTRAVEAQGRLWAGYINLWNSSLKRMRGEEAEPAVPTPARDKRFEDPDWQENQFFDFLKQFYLITSNWANDMVAEAEGLDEHTRHKADFYVKQIANALSPSNFVLTNPALLRETLANNGENLVRGMQFLVEDIKAGKGDIKIRQTDASKFEVGRNLALTPGKVIARNDVCELIQYTPTTDTVLKRPLLIVPPWINKFYILDLTPDKSFIQWAVDQGHTVFVISWVNPDERQAQKGFEHYMREGILNALDVIRRATKEEKVNAIGYCVGGTLLAVTLAYMAATGDDRIASATFFTTQVDFTHAGDLKVFVDEEQIAILERKMAERGYLDGSKMAAAFNMLRSNDLIWPYVVNNYLRGKDPFPFDLLYWNSDSTRMPAANHSFYLRNCYLENTLSRGEMVMAGERLDLSRVTIPIYNLATREDHIAPPRSVFLGCSAFGGPVDYILAGSGHIAGVVNPPARGKYQFWTGGKPEGALEDWIAAASEHPGSWWPHWDAWIRAQEGTLVKARKPGANRVKILGDAPGTYVKMRA